MKTRSADGDERGTDRLSNPQPATRNPQLNAVRWRAAYLLAALGVYLVDQTTKAWAVRRLRLGQDVTLVPRFLDLSYSENTGIAFSQLQHAGAAGRWLLVALACAALVAVLTYFFRTPRSDDRVLGACALLLAGIGGNLTDRARLGHVIDFILAHFDAHYWPTFNVADSAICLGALLLALDLLREGRRKNSGVRSQNTEARSAQ
ncbi:MAG: signal peptidase II [Pyrinomonadaceae bacterium]